MSAGRPIHSPRLRAGPPELRQSGNEHEIVFSHLMEGIGLPLDLNGGRMFVRYRLRRSVYSANLDGSNRDIAILGKETSPALHTRRRRPDIEPLDTFYVKDGGLHEAVRRCLKRSPKEINLMNAPENFDTLVLGGGTAGKLAAWTVAKEGRRTTVVGQVMPHPNLERVLLQALNFFFRDVPPLQAALWQRRSEPVKVLRCAPTADAALPRP